MAPIQLRRAISLVKDKTTIGFSNSSVEALVVKTTTHDDNTAPTDKHLDELVSRTSLSKPRAYACVASLSKRLLKTRDWVVALKALIVIHRLIIHGGKAIREEIEHAASGKSGGLLDLSANSYSYDHVYSEFVRSYASYLKVRVIIMEEVVYLDDDDDGFGGVKRLEALLDGIIGCMPAAGEARNNRIVVAAVYMVVLDSLEVYGDLCEGLSGIVDEFGELGFESWGVGVELYVKGKRQIDGLFEFYGVCRDVDGVGSLVGFPEVNRISDDLVKSLEEFLEMKKMSVSTSSEVVEVLGSNRQVIEERIWMLPPPPLSDMVGEIGDLIDLDDEEHSSNDNMGLSVWSESSASDNTDRGGGGGEDWELALVESASDLARQREDWVVEDPFAASVGVPPPLYVQMDDMEKKQRLMLVMNHNTMGKPEALYYYR